MERCPAIFVHSIHRQSFINHLSDYFRLVLLGSKVQGGFSVIRNSMCICTAFQEKINKTSRCIVRDCFQEGSTAMVFFDLQVSPTL